MKEGMLSRNISITEGTFHYSKNSHDQKSNYKFGYIFLAVTNGIIGSNKSDLFLKEKQKCVFLNQ